LELPPLPFLSSNGTAALDANISWCADEAVVPVPVVTAVEEDDDDADVDDDDADVDDASIVFDARRRNMSKSSSFVTPTILVVAFE
jgi:hypothetical protein